MSDQRAVGMVGLGKMGLPMARRLLHHGFTTIATDALAARREDFQRSGGTATDSVADTVSAAGTVVLMLPNSEVVDAVLLDPATTSRLRPGILIIDMGSSEPLRTRQLAGRLSEEFGVQLIDAPVSGGVSGAEAGSLTIMAGGDPTLVEGARPILEAMGRVAPTGPVASGHALKALNNLLSATHLLVTSEAMLVGKQFGLDPAVMLDAINGSSGRSGSTENKWPNFILPGTFNSGFTLQLMLKDMRIAVELARALGVPGRLGECSVGLWDEAAASLPKDADHTEIARWLADRLQSPAAPSN